MGNCKSAAQVFSDLWDEYGEVAKALGCEAAHALSADTDNVIDVQQCLEAANKAETLAERMTIFANRKAQGSWSTIGPRPLTLGERERGTLRGTFGRVFICVIPMPADEVTVRVRKRGGKGKASVTVCKIDANGRMRELWDTTFRPGKKNIGQTKRRTLRGVRGHYLQVHLDGKSLSRKFAYSLRVNQ